MPLGTDAILLHNGAYATGFSSTANEGVKHAYCVMNVLNIYWPFSKVTHPLCMLHLAMAERLEYSSDPESCAGGDSN